MQCPKCGEDALPLDHDEYVSLYTCPECSNLFARYNDGRIKIVRECWTEE